MQECRSAGEYLQPTAGCLGSAALAPVRPCMRRCFPPLFFFFFFLPQQALVCCERACERLSSTSMRRNRNHLLAACSLMEPAIIYLRNAT